jgi:pilus assembly protein Flp/PilA
MTFLPRNLSQRARGIEPARGNGDRSIAGEFRRLMQDQSGATAIEYGLIAAGIALAILPIFNGIGTRLKSTFTTLQTSIK